MDDDFDYDDDDVNECEGCGRTEMDDGHCPLCCSMGSYAPGSEECDWCKYDSECARHAYGHRARRNKGSAPKQQATGQVSPL